MSDGKTQIFISFKNTNSDGEKTIESLKADEIYNHLVKTMGYRVFMMNETLASSGVSNYKKIIDSSLEEAKVLIILTSAEANVNSDWVRYEWDTFLGEMLANRKKGHIFTVLFNPMRIDLLPIGLRKYQSFKDDNLNALYSFIEGAFHEVKEPGRIAFIYPCVFSKKEDGRIKAFFPDLKIDTGGANYDDAFLNAQNLLLRFFIYAVKYEIDVETPSKIEDLRNQINADDFLMLVSAIVNVNGEAATILN